MTSRFFPNSLKLSSNSVPRRYTHTGGGERQISGRECDARSRTHGVDAGTSAYPNRAIASLTPEGAGHRVGGRGKGSQDGVQGGTWGRGGRGHSPSFPGSLEASTHRFHDCPSIASGLGRGLRSPTVAIAAAAEVEAALGPPSSSRRRRGGGCCRWGCGGCCCCCCRAAAAAVPPAAAAARRGSPLTSSTARSDILSAPTM